jgi:hypothetical protein
MELILILNFIKLRKHIFYFLKNDLSDFQDWNKMFIFNIILKNNFCSLLTVLGPYIYMY